MKCTKQPRFLLNRPVQITNILEVHLDKKQWQSIAAIARKRRKTFSTVTRFCVLRLARKTHLAWTSRLQKCHSDARLRFSRAKSMAEIHRHRMCLYGEDEKLIRLAAMDLGLTLSGFIRLAIELYLTMLAVEKHSPRHIPGRYLVAEAIRFVESILILALNGGPFPALRELHCRRWALESYW